MRVIRPRRVAPPKSSRNQQQEQPGPSTRDQAVETDNEYVPPADEEGLMSLLESVMAPPEPPPVVDAPLHVAYHHQPEPQPSSSSAIVPEDERSEMQMEERSEIPIEASSTVSSTFSGCSSSISTNASYQISGIKSSSRVIVNRWSQKPWERGTTRACILRKLLPKKRSTRTVSRWMI